MKKLTIWISVICLPFLLQGDVFAKKADTDNASASVIEKAEKIDFSNAPALWKEKSNEIEDKLLKGQPVEIKSMREYLLERGMTVDFSGNVFVVYLNNGLKCVFKYYDDTQEKTKTKSEIIAYKLSKETGIGNVPPVVWREIKLNDGKIAQGYLALFVNSEIDILNYEDDDFFDMLKKMDSTEINNYKIFNFVFGNFDVGAHNLLICDGKPIMIDNETIDNPWCVRYGEVPFVIFYAFDKMPTQPIKSSEFPFESVKFANFEERKKIENEFDYFPTRRGHNFILYKNIYWVQLNCGDFVERIKQLIYPDMLPDSTKEALKNLDYQKLLEIFEANENNRHVNQLITGILERRDMLIENFSEN